MKKGTCPLCQQGAVSLVRSHIIPELVYRQMPKDEPVFVDKSLFDGDSLHREAITRSNSAEVLLCQKCDNQLLQPYEREAEAAFFSLHSLNRPIFVLPSDSQDSAYLLTGVDSEKINLYITSLMYRSSVAKNAFGAGIKLHPTNVELFRRALLRGTKKPATLQIRAVYHSVDISPRVGISLNYEREPVDSPRIWVLALGHLFFLVEESIPVSAWGANRLYLPEWSSPFREEGMKITLLQGLLAEQVVQSNLTEDLSWLSFLLHGENEDEKLVFKEISKKASRIRVPAVGDSLPGWSHFYSSLWTFWRFHRATNDNIYLHRWIPSSEPSKNEKCFLVEIESGIGSAIDDRVLRAIRSLGEGYDLSFCDSSSDLVVALERSPMLAKQLALLRDLVKGP